LHILRWQCWPSSTCGRYRKEKEWIHFMNWKKFSRSHRDAQKPRGPGHTAPKSSLCHRTTHPPPRSFLYQVDLERRMTGTVCLLVRKNHSRIGSVLGGFRSDCYEIHKNCSVKTSISIVIRCSGLLTTIASHLLGRYYCNIKASAIADRPN
jgi:hypothetical protein